MHFISMKLSIYFCVFIICLAFVSAFELGDLDADGLPDPGFNSDNVPSDDDGSPGSYSSSSTFYDDGHLNSPEVYSPSTTNATVPVNVDDNLTTVIAKLKQELNSKFLTESEIKLLISQNSLSLDEVNSLIEENKGERWSVINPWGYFIFGGLIILFFIILVVFKKSLKRKTVKREHVEVKAIVEYIKKNSEFSSFQLKKALINQGWLQDEIRLAFRIARRY